jgi:hypothetical protein
MLNPTKPSLEPILILESFIRTIGFVIEPENDDIGELVKVSKIF